MKSIFQQMEVSGVLPEIDDYKQSLLSWCCFCKKNNWNFYISLFCIYFCILAEVDDHWKHQFSPIGILGKKMHPGCYCYSSIQIRIRLHWRFLQRFPFTIWENCLFSLWHELRIDFYSTSKCPCCVISALSWDTNENPSTDKLTRAIN